MYEGLEEIKPGLYVNKNNKVVYPVLKNVPGRLTWGNIHWKNAIVGSSWLNIAIIFFLFSSMFFYQHDTAACRELINHPCKYLNHFDCYLEIGSSVTPYGINVSKDFNQSEYEVNLKIIQQELN
jgi:hypothetical protein